MVLISTLADIQPGSSALLFILSVYSMKCINDSRPEGHLDANS